MALEILPQVYVFVTVCLHFLHWVSFWAVKDKRNKYDPVPMFCIQFPADIRSQCYLDFSRIWGYNLETIQIFYFFYYIFFAVTLVTIRTVYHLRGIWCNIYFSFEVNGIDLKCAEYKLSPLFKTQ